MSPEQEQLAEALYETTLALNSTLNLDELLELILSTVERVVPHDAADIMLLNQGTAQVVRHRGYIDYGHPHIMEVSFALTSYATFRRMYETGEPLLIPDVEQAPEWVRNPERRWIRGYIGAPIRSKEEIVGFLNLTSTSPNFFTLTHVKRLQAFANQVGIAIGNARLLEAERKQRKMSQTLSRVGLALNSTLDLPHLLDLICQESLKVFQVETALIWLVRGDELFGYAGYGPNRDRFIGLKIPLAEPSVLGAKVIREKQPKFVNYAPHTDQVNQPLVQLLQIQAILGIPILREDKAIGALMIIDQHQPNRFREEDIQTAMIFANYAAVAIQNALLFEAERTQRQISETLHEATTTLIAPLQAWEVINNLLVQLSRVVPYDSACVFLLEENRLKLVAGQGIPHTELIGQSYALEDEILFKEIRQTLQPVYLADAQRDPRFKNWGAAYYVHGWMGVPLIARGQVIGLLTIDSRQVDAYGAAETTLVQSFANQAAVAITNTQLFEQTQVALAHTEALYQATRMLIGVESLNDLLQAVVDGVATALPARCVTLILINLEQRQATHFVDGGDDSFEPYRASFEELWKGLTGWVLRELKPALSLKDIPDPREGSLVKQRRLERETGSVIVVPLQYRGQVIGTLTAANGLDEPDFTEQDVELLVVMANQAAVAVENVRLLEAERLARKQAEALREETRQVLAQTTRLYELSTEFVSALSVAEVANLVIEKVVQATHAHSAVINLLNEAGNFEAAFGPPHEAPPRPDGSTMIICRSGEAMIINDIWLNPETVQPYLIEQNIRASIGLPLKTREQTIGALFVRFQQPRQFSQREVETLFIFANQAAIAIQNARLYQLQKRIQRQERMAAVGQLAAGIAHDFNNILTSIIGFAELLQANPELPLSAQADLERITKQGQRAARLVRQILDFSSQTITEKRALDLKSALKEMIKLLERTIPEDIQIFLEAESQAYMVTADLAQLQQAITNLALNARDAMPDGGRLQFRLAYLTLVPPEPLPIVGMPPGNWIRLSVSDTGIGIPPHLHTQIFEPFFTTKEVGQGTGLGLAQVYGIVKQHDGYITVESEAGAGATFNLYLPALAAPAETVSPEKPAGEIIPRGNGETILLVEDDASVRYIGSTMLQHLGYKVLTASQGQEALALYKQRQTEIKIVLTDMTMPEMGGQTLATLLYQEQPRVKVVILTGYPLKTEAKELQTPGVQDWLQKPLKLDQLAQTLYRILR